jgi:hypothetical protein
MRACGEIHEEGTTVMSEMYCETQKTHRTCHSEQKAWNADVQCIHSTHDSACPLTAARIGTLLEHLNWELFDLTPSDYHLFALTYLKKWLRSQLFNSNEELMGGVKTWLSFAYFVSTSPYVTF